MKTDVKIADNRLQLTRVFNAPRPQVFGWWSSAEKLQQWSGCKEATSCKIEMDFRVGGGFTQKMQIHGNEFAFSGRYDEIVVPERIVYHAKFDFAVTRVVVEFFDEGAGTKVVLAHEQCPSEDFCKNVSQGIRESFDDLANLIDGKNSQ